MVMGHESLPSSKSEGEELVSRHQYQCQQRTKMMKLKPTHLHIVAKASTLRDEYPVLLSANGIDQAHITEK